MNYAKMVFKQVAEFILIAFKFVSSRLQITVYGPF